MKHGSLIYFLDGEGKLKPGSVTEEHFLLLIEMSSIHSDKVISALKDFFVMGYTRKEACLKNDVSQSYFSISLSRVQHMSKMASNIAPFYMHLWCQDGQ
ncbi:adhesin biosynthesis transcription regulatory family protein [Escherichia coli]|nr:adhesin biosynthesis transcription regulatory family protein [Escherichia coli]